MATQYYTATSLDGFIADGQNSLDWLFALSDEREEGSYPAFIAKVGAVAMGSTTYEWILEHVHADAERLQPWGYEQPTWVFSTRPQQRVEGADLRFVSGDVRPVHEEMLSVAVDRNVWIVGGGELVGQFHDAGLLDEVIVSVGSVTLGGGAPLLPRRIELSLRSARQLGTGMAELTYDVRGPRRPAGT
ncbi:MAG: dihydrofolate reductase family protein [Actinomycetota bacterium]|nr:dihydrofolate reductase family protein [Actinomycetota bacterium]